MSSTPTQYALILISLALEAGVDRSDLLEGSALANTEIRTLGARVPDSDFRILVTNAQRLTGDPALGLHLGQRLNLSAHAVLGQAFMTCRNLSEVMHLFLEYSPMLAQDLTLNYRIKGDRVCIEVENFDSEWPYTFGPECMAAAMRNTLTGLLGDSAIALRFAFPYPEPPHLEIYREVLGDDLRFGCDTGSWSFDRSLLQHPLPSSNPALRELYEAECARLLSDLEDNAALCAQTLRLLRKFEGQYPKMPQIAGMLNLSPRTYRRRLAGEGNSFQQLLDTVRGEHATRQLRDGRLPISSIAYRLGFSDPSNFRRAYLRWTGSTPGDVRRLAKGETL